MKLATFSRGIKSIGILEEALGHDVVALRGYASNDSDVSGYLGWGRKSSGVKALEASKRNEKSVIFLEDGFLGYWGHPSSKNTRLSLIVDNKGIYYDARSQSDLESLLEDGGELTVEQNQRIDNVCKTITNNHFSKYNHHASSRLPDELAQQLSSACNVVLVVDQTAGDQSITCGLAKDEYFPQMLHAACTENPESLVVVKTHPDVLAGKKKSAIGKVFQTDQVIWVADDVHPHALIEVASKVYVMTSQVGFEALMFGKPVVCFGVPFYSGWGLTDDRGQVPDRRSRQVTVNELLHASLVQYPIYVHPDTGVRCEIEDITAWLIRQRRSVQKKYPKVLAVGFSLWKKAWLSVYTTDFAECLDFVSKSKLNRLTGDEPVLVWGARHADKVKQDFPNRRVFTMEDGFVRSSGLGTDLKRPSSLIVDEKGIYYDSRSESDLENQLNTSVLSPANLQEARSVISQLIDKGTTKYNVGGSLDASLVEWIKGQKKANREVILVPGQVEGDASIEFGSPHIRTNLELLKSVRKDHPDACVIYKPHPDIIAKNRKNETSFDEEKNHSDRVLVGSNIALLYAEVDRVCVMTSLSGFEALLRGVRVSVYGLPFYAGWGLTDDREPCERRRAQLSLEELVYISLIKYPRYVNWDTWKFCSLEVVMRQLSDTPIPNGRGASYVSRQIQKLKYFAESYRYK